MPKYKHIDKTFFKKWSIPMAYTLGLFSADGNVVITKRGTHYFALYSFDKSILQAISQAMMSEHIIAKRSSRSGNVYRFQVGSKEMVADLFSLGLTVGKASRMVFPVIPKEYVSHFIRGYFDGDGNVWSGIVHKKRKTKSITITVSFTSASVVFLKGLLHTLRIQGVTGGSLYVPKSDAFGRLSFSKNDSLKIYKVMYNTGAVGKFYLQRKKRIFDRFIKMRT